MLPTIFLELPSGQFLVGWGELETHESVEASTSRASPHFFLSDFPLTNPTPWIIPERTAILSRQGLLGEFAAVAAVPGDISWKPIDHEAFKESYQRIIAGIRENAFQKLVAVETQEGVIPSAWWPGVFAVLAGRLLRSPAPRLRCYGFSRGDFGIVGATPEILFERNGQMVTTTALAGTQAHSQELNNPKDQREHQYVIDDLATQLSLLGAVTILATEQLSFGAVSHIQTHLACSLREPFPFQRIVQAIHPSAALGVYPRTAEGSHVLSSLRDRHSYFAAPFGAVVSQEESVCVATIRGIQWKGLEATITSGCGVIAESDLSRELSELQMKRESVKERFRKPYELVNQSEEAL